MRVIIVVISLFCISLCFGQQKVESKLYGTMLKTLLSHTVSEIDVSTAKNNLGSATFLDARPEEEYNVSHIENAIRVGYDNFDINKIAYLKRDTPIVVYCSVGYRSEKVAEQLQTNGFKNVYNLYGGLFEWVNQDQPIYKGEKETDSIHAYNKVWGSWVKNASKIKVYP